MSPLSGTILAAVGTALPESIVTVVAVILGKNAAERQIGVGTALGGALALGALAYSVVGLTLMGSIRLGVHRKRELDADYRRLSHDQAWFLCIFVCKFALGLLLFPGKRWFGVLLVIFIASRVFVLQLKRTGAWLGMSPQLAALLLSPIATEMPEVTNAVIWVRQGKQRMALANISGAMMVQAAVPTALGLFGTPWLFSFPVIVAASVTVLAVGVCS